MNITRRALLGGVAATAAVATVGCANGTPGTTGSPAGSSAASAGGAQVTINYGFWGTPKKAELIQKAIAAFEAKNPNIKVRAEASPWAGYWEAMATKTAGGGAPEVIHMSERYVREYGERGALADIEKLDGLNLADLDKDLLNLGRAGDAGLFAVAAGLNTHAVAINEALFDQHGVALPDDKTWTWNDFYAASKALADKGVIGASYGVSIENLRVWLRQKDQDIYAADGKGVGYQPDALNSYLDHLEMLKANGGETPDQMAEAQGLPLEAQPFSTGKMGISWVYSNQIGEFAKAPDSRLSLRLIPSHDGDAKRNGMFYKGSEFYSISAQAKDEKLAAAAKFVDFMVNDEAAIDAVRLAMGVPPNKKLVDSLRPSMSEMDKHVADFIGDLGQYLTIASPGPSPKGAGNVESIVSGQATELLAGRQDKGKTAENITSSINRELTA